MSKVFYVKAVQTIVTHFQLGILLEVIVLCSKSDLQENLIKRTDSGLTSN